MFRRPPSNFWRTSLRLVVVPSGGGCRHGFVRYPKKARCKRWRVSADHVDIYVPAVEKLVAALRATFPSSTVIWRMMHPAMKHSITPNIVRIFNNGVRSLAKRIKMPILDTEQMMRKLGRRLTPFWNDQLGEIKDAYGTHDGRHLHAFLDLAVFNVLLNMARKIKISQGEDRPETLL